ncbi:MAG: chromosomal replication initiator protein DnaA [Planctomycetes bacterium]|nr:chromosomal replication initiator protein DnaA [Planctomycetota bacterium]
MVKSEATETLWAEAAVSIRRAVGEQSFNLWLSQAIPIQLSPEIVELGVPSLYVQEFVSARMRDQVVAACGAVLGGARPELKLTINGHLFRKMREAAATSEGEAAPLPRPATASGAAAPPDDPARAAAEAAAGARRRPKDAGYARQVFNLSPKYTLDRFVVGRANRLAHDAVLRIADQPGTMYNPLFIHGGSGLGKTHLLQGLAHEVLSRNPSGRLLYVTCEYFTNQYVAALQSGEINRFRARFRGVDLLVVDDIQGLGNKAATQEEFLQTFNELTDAGRQVVMASDAHPRQLARIREDLIGRFLSGMLAQVQPPDVETRVEIVKRRLAGYDVEIPAEVVRFVAERVTRSVRELEGAVVRLVAYSSLAKEPVTLSLARQAIADFLSIEGRYITLSDIENRVISHLNVTHGQLHSRLRRRDVAYARQVCVTLGRMLTDASLNEIGRYFGGKDHSTVLFAERKIKGLMQSDPDVRQFVDLLTEELRRR